MGKSSVSIEYNPDTQKSMAGALDRLGDLAVILKNKHVAVKPNETWASKNDLTACTQADTLDALIIYIKDFRPRKITVTGGSGAAETGEVFKLLGIDKIIKKHAVEFFDHNRKPFKTIKLMYGPQKEVMVNPYVTQYETLISLAQLKVHHAATVTLTMKNIGMSFPAADYYGHSREKMLHPHNFFIDLDAFIAGMCQRFPIHLGIISGHPAMTVRGPIGGETFETGLTIASRDFVACDSAGAKILGFEGVRHIMLAQRLKLGNADLSAIKISGVSLKEAALPVEKSH
ncbi:MAG: DUF362 domain-containing protein [Candidatus Omnitrophica bacterium]|nr:DUF362 domain-containing protein [Candidatus Omnitrophota bacterium]MDD5552516.1 DUF362 domain-containing protein [Candidatus Omnitrophota bacterium]